MRRHEGETIRNRTLVLDGEAFRGCRFINADLRWKGAAPFVLDGNSYEGAFNLELARAAGDELAAAELDRDVRRFGFDLEIAERLAQSREAVWRFHTLLPRSVENSGNEQGNAAGS